MFQAGEAASDNVVQHPRARGRKDASGQEKVIETSVVADRIDDLVKAYFRKVDAADKLNEAIKSAAEDSGLLSAVVRKYVIAKAQKTWPAEQRKVEQLALLFLDVGE